MSDQAVGAESAVVVREDPAQGAPAIGEQPQHMREERPVRESSPDLARAALLHVGAAIAEAREFLGVGRFNEDPEMAYAASDLNFLEGRIEQALLAVDIRNV